MIRAALAALMLLTTGPAIANDDRPLLLGTTTSVDNSGILKFLMRGFHGDTGIEVRTIVRGTGAILQLGRSGDFDIILVHDEAAERAFVGEGAGATRNLVMTSRFLIVGPAEDPANVRSATDAPTALVRIAAGKHRFISRGDDSGTNTAELRLWSQANIDPRAASGLWYRETGSGMGATLNVASAMTAYVFTESGSWANFSNRGDLEILSIDGPGLRNPYGIIPVNPTRHPHVAADAARRLVDWLTGPAGQTAIAGFRVNGEQPFQPASALPATPANR